MRQTMLPTTERVNFPRSWGQLSQASSEAYSMHLNLPFRFSQALEVPLPRHTPECHFFPPSGHQALGGHVRFKYHGTTSISSSNGLMVC